MFLYNGNLDAARYCRVLEGGLLESADILHPDGYRFIHDNATCHSAYFTQQWLIDNGVQTVPWPSSSPDLNPIQK